MRVELALLAGLVVLYNLNLRQVSSYDTYASRFVPISILRDGDLALNEFFPEVANTPIADIDLSGYVIPINGRVYDSHPPIGPLLALPVYAIPVWLGVPDDPRQVANLFSKLSASLMASLSAVIVFVATRRIALVCAASGRTAPPRGQTGVGVCETRVALIAALTYALATPVWSTASQAMWSHTPAALAYAAALWGLISGWPGLAGVATAMAVVARPATAAAAGLLSVFVLHRAWLRSRGQAVERLRSLFVPDTVRFGIGAGIVGGLGVVYNLRLFDNVVGGAPLRTAYWNEQLQNPDMFGGSLSTGLLGLTVSPSRGLFIFSPVLLLAIIGAVNAWRGRLAHGSGDTEEAWSARLLGRYAGLGALGILLTYSKFIAWWGGHGFGPRYLVDAMPFVGILLGFVAWPPLEAGGFVRSGRRRVAAVALTILMAYSVFVQALGSLCWPSPWTLADPPFEQRLWNWRDSQIVACARAGPRLDPMAERLLLRFGMAR